MRRRRSAFHADSDEEYMAKVKTSDIIESSPKCRSLELSAYTHQDKDSSPPALQNRDSSLHAFVNLFSTPKITMGCPVHFEGINFARREDNPNNFESDSDMSESSRKSSETNDSCSKLPRTTKSKHFVTTSIRTILVGASQVRKSRFIDYLFGREQEDQTDYIRDPLDLKIRAHLKSDEIVKYHMWIKCCSDCHLSDKLKSIYMIYYKTVSSFIFVYSVDDRDSFIAVAREIKALINDVGPQKFRGILIGLKGYDNTMQQEDPQGVSSVEAEQLSRETGLNAFLEVDLSENSQRESILNLLESFKKGLTGSPLELQEVR